MTSKGSDQPARMRRLSEPLLFTHTTLLEISHRGSYLLTNASKKRLSLSWEFHCSTLHPRSATPILGNIFSAHKFTQEAPLPFLGISLLNIASKKRHAHPWKYFYCPQIHTRNASPFLGNFIAQHCIQEAPRPSLENIFIAHKFIQKRLVLS